MSLLGLYPFQLLTDRFKFIQLLSTTTYHQRVLQQLVSDPLAATSSSSDPRSQFFHSSLIIHGCGRPLVSLKSPAIWPECCSNYTSMASRP
ncbi:hypothetical protein CEXT_332021 [Caerostris extrusa]|uniref:Uncharacterized protein n=1 Tax=Caerostris extrusa TaxID=172846 RepID=A0AAV4RJM0_CAEEX|nr:hypothetical protein CEXT_332021 [Caerostris extrusa]